MARGIEPTIITPVNDNIPNAQIEPSAASLQEIMINTNGPADRNLEPTRRWLERNYEQYPKGINNLTTNRDGTHIELDEIFDTDVFKVILEESEGYEAEEYEDGSVSALKREELSGGAIYKHTVGITFGQTGLIPLGGYQEPVGPDGEPKDDTVKETLELLVLYLEAKYG